jgi:hypothetical protein
MIQGIAIFWPLVATFAFVLAFAAVAKTRASHAALVSIVVQRIIVSLIGFHEFGGHLFEVTDKLKQRFKPSLALLGAGSLPLRVLELVLQPGLLHLFRTQFPVYLVQFDFVHLDQLS